MSRLNAYATELLAHLDARNWAVIVTMAEEAQHIFPDAMDWEGMANFAFERLNEEITTRTVMEKLRKINDVCDARNRADAGR